MFSLPTSEISLQGLIMLEGIVIILHLVTSAGLKSSSDVRNQLVRNLTQFSTPMYPDFCQCMVQGAGAARSAASTDTPSHLKISSIWLDGAFPSGKLKYLELTKSV